MEEQPAEIGEIIGGYRLEALLGKGGMSHVYRGRHTLLGRAAAVKVLASELASDKRYVDRFFREARIVNDIDHPNIVDIIDFVSTENPKRVAAIMELIEGDPLSAHLKRHRFTTLQAVNICLQVCRALEAVHAIQVIHRDLKPANLLLTSSLETDLSDPGAVRVLDFGIAKIDDANAIKTGTGAVLGTPAYMAPEQVGARPATSATDIYAVGEIFYELLTGRRAFEGDNMMVLQAKLREGPVALPLPPDVPLRDQIQAFLQALMAFEPESRPSLAESRYWFETHREVLLETAETGPSVPPQPLPRSPSATSLHMSLPGVARSPAEVRLFGLAAAAMLTLISVLAVMLWQRGGADITSTARLIDPGAANVRNEAPVVTEPPVPVPPSHVVRIESTPPGAEVLDEHGGTLGHTPHDLDLGSNGARTLSLRLEGFDERSVVIGGENAVERYALVARRSAKSRRSGKRAKTKRAATKRASGPEPGPPRLAPTPDPKAGAVEPPPPPAKDSPNVMEPLRKREVPTW